MPRIEPLRVFPRPPADDAGPDAVYTQVMIFDGVPHEVALEYYKPGRMPTGLGYQAEPLTGGCYRFREITPCASPSSAAPTPPAATRRAAL